MLAEVERTSGVDVHHPFKHGFVRAGNGHVHSDAGHVQHYVDAAVEALGHGVDHGLDCFLAAHIALVGLKLRPVLFCSFGQAGHVAGVDVNTGDHGALCDKGKRTFVPNTRVCSGYDRNSIL